MNLKNKNVLVYGLSASGEWASKLLLKHKANVFLFDDDKEKMHVYTIKNCYYVRELNENIIKEVDFLIVSPSIEINNDYLVIARKYHKKIYSEVEFASLFCKNLVAITGTNGKTTTTKLVRDILNKKHKSIACGNIGYPLSRAVLHNKHYLKVCEISSFMLENCDDFCPHVATILNIQQDHLVRHKTMENYKNIKLSIYKNLTKKDYAVVNLDSKIMPKQDCLTITYSYGHFADVYVKDGYIFLHDKKIVAINELKLKGKHNIYNVLCAICVGYIYKVKPAKMREALINFKNEKYRIEDLGKVNDIRFINDSKSTNITSTLVCVDTIKNPSILLVGGSQKNLSYKELFQKLNKRVKLVVAFGEISKELEMANENKFKFEICNNLNDAFNFALLNALPNDAIILSPASASYDQFLNYEQRGKAFETLVKDYAETTKKR